jgi:hypothetical protein
MCKQPITQEANVIPIPDDFATVLTSGPEGAAASLLRPHVRCACRRDRDALPGTSCPCACHAGRIPEV